MFIKLCSLGFLFVLFQTMESLSLKCPECCKYYQTSKMLKKHVARIHSNTKAFYCNKCKKDFTTKDSHIKHMNLHARKNFKCDMCDLQFVSGMQLTSHMVVHYNVGNKGSEYECNDCGKKCALKANFIQHIKTHYQNKYIMTS